MKLEDWDEINERFCKCRGKIDFLPRFARRDCRRMSRAVSEMLRLADQERVHCRRLNCVSSQFEHYMARAQEALTNFEGHVIFASLMRNPNEEQD
jgi:hypothetical protein